MHISSKSHLLFGESVISSNLLSIKEQWQYTVRTTAVALTELKTSI